WPGRLYRIDAPAWADGAAHLPPHPRPRARRRGRLSGHLRLVGTQGRPTAPRGGGATVAERLAAPRRLPNRHQHRDGSNPPLGSRTTGRSHDACRSRSRRRGHLERGPADPRCGVERAARRGTPAVDRLLLAGEDTRRGGGGVGTAARFGGAASGESTNTSGEAANPAWHHGIGAAVGGAFGRV